MRSKVAWLMFGCVAGLGGVVASAGAQTCTADSPCPKGFSCEVTAVSGCATPAARPAMRPACDGGSECSAPADNPAPPPAQRPCTQQEYRSCVPGNCAADGDCASGMVCHERSTGTCSADIAIPCAPGAKCAPLPMPVCTETVEHVCVPRYVLPCKQASDCGAGFTCEAQQTCGCSGSAGAPTPSGPTPPDAGTPSFAPAPPLPPPDCTCEPTSERYCKVIDTACRADSDCPNEFVCQQTAPPTPVPAIDCDPASGKGDAGVCAADRGIQAPAPGAYRCIPRYEYIDADYGAPHRGDVAIPTSGPVPQTGERPTKDPSIPPTTTPGTAADAGVSAPATDETAPPHVRACSVSSLGDSGGGAAGELGLWAVLGMLALSAFVRRRNAG